MSRELQAVALLLIVLGLAWLGYGVLFGDDGAARLTVASVQGEVSRLDGLGNPAPIESGQALLPRDRLVAGEGGRAVLALGTESRVTVEPSSSVRVLSADEFGVRLELEGGRVQATIRPGSGSFGITADGRAVVTEDADFTAARDEDGTLGVEATRGALTLEGVDGAERLAAGERLVVAEDGAALVQSATEELLLNVAWPTDPRTRATELEVRGNTEPGARVRIGREGAWTEVRADRAGAFVARVPLSEGDNDLRVEAASVLGGAVAVSSTVVRDTKAPSVGVEVRY